MDGPTGETTDAEYRQRIHERAPSMTPAQRRVAAVLDQDPGVVAFGTVAEVAAVCQTGAATVVRLAATLGYEGFTDLQRAIRTDLARQLRPAAERLRPGTAPTGQARLADHLALELENLERTFQRVDPSSVTRAAELLAALDRPLVVLGGDAVSGALQLAVATLETMRDGVSLIDGNPVWVQRRLAVLPPTSIVVACDVRRYDAWVLGALEHLHAAGHTIVVITDRDLSPLAGLATEVFTVAAAAVGPFDSMTSIVSLLQLLIAATADQLVASAPARLSRIEAAWSAGALLVDAAPPLDQPTPQP